MSLGMKIVCLCGEDGYCYDDIDSNGDANEGIVRRQGPRLSIRIDIWILPSDTETSAATLSNLSRKSLFGHLFIDL